MDLTEYSPLQPEFYDTLADIILTIAKPYTDIICSEDIALRNFTYSIDVNRTFTKIRPHVVFFSTDMYHTWFHTIFNITHTESDPGTFSIHGDIVHSSHGGGTIPIGRINIGQPPGVLIITNNNDPNAFLEFDLHKLKDLGVVKYVRRRSKITLKDDAKQQLLNSFANSEYRFIPYALITHYPTFLTTLKTILTEVIKTNPDKALLDESIRIFMHDIDVEIHDYMEHISMSSWCSPQIYQAFQYHINTMIKLLIGEEGTPHITFSFNSVSSTRHVPMFKIENVQVDTFTI